MKAITVASRPPVRPSEFTVTVTGCTHEVVAMQCTCEFGEQLVVWPVAALRLLTGSFLPCPHCFADTSTRVVRDIDISDL